MSLEVAIVGPEFAIVVSDGLQRNRETGQVTGEHGLKQIRLGQNCVISGGGFAHELDEIFWLTLEAYYKTAGDEAAKLAAVKDAFNQFFEGKTFPGFNRTVTGAFLLTRESGGFHLLNRNCGREPEGYHVGPGDTPKVVFHTPTFKVEALCLMADGVAFLRPLSEGAPPERIIANAREIYKSAAKLENPPRLNTNLRISVLGNVAIGPPCEADPMLKESLSRFLGQMAALFEEVSAA